MVHKLPGFDRITSGDMHGPTWRASASRNGFHGWPRQSMPQTQMLVSSTTRTDQPALRCRRTS